MQPVNQLINLDEYIGHPRNYNTHPDAQVQRIMASLTKFGQPRSVVVWRGQYLAGHGVAEAARRLGWKQLRADVLPDDYPEHLALAYVVADNELARQSDPDQAALAAILQEVGRVDAELVQAAGFGQQELDRLLASLEPPQDPMAEWQGMPEFENEDDSGDFHALLVRFGSQSSIDTFAKLVGQTVTVGVKSIWYPKRERESYSAIITNES